MTLILMMLLKYQEELPKKMNYLSMQGVPSYLKTSKKSNEKEKDDFEMSL